jgi:hypothetical protein
VSRPTARSRSGWGRGRGGGERGAALVEMALVLPLLFVLVFGMIDFASVYSDYQSLRQGTREGARQTSVSTTPGPPGATSWDSTNCQTVGITTAGDGYDLVCYTKNRIGLNESKTRVSVFFAAPWTPGQGVTICTQYAAGSLTGVFGSMLNGRALQSHLEIRIEQPSATFTAPVQETPLPGTSWPATCTQT